MLDTPQVTFADEQLTAVIPLIVPCHEIVQVMKPAIEEVLSTLSTQNITPAGACFSYHRRKPTDSFDFEVGFPVSAQVSPTGRVRPGKLPAAKVARTIYRGGYEGLGAAWGEFIAWIEAEGLATQEALWECYLSGPESSSDPDAWRTELNRPLIS